MAGVATIAPHTFIHSIYDAVMEMDYELSLVSPIAFLVLVGYIVYLAVSTCLWIATAAIGLISRLAAPSSDTRTSASHNQSQHDASIADDTKSKTKSRRDPSKTNKEEPSQSQPPPENLTGSAYSQVRHHTVTILLLLMAIADPPARLSEFHVAPPGNYNNSHMSTNATARNGTSRLHGQQILKSGESQENQHVPVDHELADLLVGPDERLREVLNLMPDLAKGPSPPWILRNRHMQIFPFMIQNEIHRMQGIPYQRLHVSVLDCHDKLADGCSSQLHRTSAKPADRGDGDRSSTHESINMTETITIDVFPPFQDVDSPYNKNFNASSPVIIFNPGLRCHSQDLPGTTIVRKAYEVGIRSVVINRRAHTLDQPLNSPRWNLFGDVEDIEQVYWYLKNEHLPPNTAMFFHGISSGTALTVTSLSKWDRRNMEHPDHPSPSFVASVSIAPGCDISRTLGRDRILWPYHDILLPMVKLTFIRNNEELLRAHDSDAVDAALASTTLQDFVHEAAPFSGFGNRTAYYNEINPVQGMTDITTPKLILNAVDDPCCSIASLYETSPYENHDSKTFAQLVSEAQRSILAVTKTGSHCPFFDVSSDGSIFTRDAVTGGWMLNSWADRMSIEFYMAALKVYDERRFL